MVEHDELDNYFRQVGQAVVAYADTFDAALPWLLANLQGYTGPMGHYPEKIRGLAASDMLKGLKAELTKGGHWNGDVPDIYDRLDKSLMRRHQLIHRVSVLSTLTDDATIETIFTPRKGTPTTEAFNLRTSETEAEVNRALDTRDDAVQLWRLTMLVGK